MDEADEIGLGHNLKLARVGDFGPVVKRGVPVVHAHPVIARERVRRRERALRERVKERAADQGEEGSVLVPAVDGLAVAAFVHRVFRSGSPEGLGEESRAEGGLKV